MRGLESARGEVRVTVWEYNVLSETVWLSFPETVVST